MRIERILRQSAKTGKVGLSAHRPRRSLEPSSPTQSEKPGSRLARILEEGLHDLSDQEIVEAFKKLKEELNVRDLAALNGGWDYQRETWGRGHIQFDPKTKHLRDGSINVHGYWYFHYIVAGRRRSKYIGKDGKLVAWKEENPVGFDGVTDLER